MERDFILRGSHVASLGGTHPLCLHPALSLIPILNLIPLNEIGETCCAMKIGLLAQITALRVDDRHFTLHCMLVLTAQSCYVPHS